ILLVLQRRKSPDRENIEVLSKNGSRIFHMLNSISAHDRFFFKFQCPSFASDIEDDRFHAQVLRSNLSAQSCTHAWIQKQAANSLACTKIAMPERICLVLQSCLHQSLDISCIFYRNKLFHFFTLISTLPIRPILPSPHQ